VLTVASLRRHRCRTSTALRCTLVVPAHDEEPGIGATLDSLHCIDYPSHRLRVVVVADNCTDRTAEVARAHGATVVERTETTRRGKGYALEMVFGQLLADGWTDMVVVVDADTLVDHGLVQRLAGHLEQGALVVQADYRVRNPGASWRTRLVDVGFTCSHLVRSSGRRAFGASAGLRGNGMAFHRDALERVPYAAFSVVEDLEYGILLGRAGIPVDYCSTTWVAGDMPDNAGGAESQRIRWEHGRREIRRSHVAALWGDAVRQRSVLLGDLAVDLAVPPLATSVAALGAATVVAGAGSRWFGRLPLWITIAGWVAVLSHVGTGVARSQSGWSALPAMARVPHYALWKAIVSIRRRIAGDGSGALTWTRTARSSGQGHDEHQRPDQHHDHEHHDHEHHDHEHHEPSAESIR
jgi:cellulose synthase/poly-beta-1,6-N-acetylglucosamine synthase-like glycosyltransferase